MTIRALKKLAIEVLGSPVQISQGKGGYWHDSPNYFVNVYGPGKRDVRVTAKDKGTALRACAAALEAMGEEA